MTTAAATAGTAPAGPVVGAKAPRSVAVDAALTMLMGGFLGYVLSRLGFSSWDEVHAMFTFADLRLVLVFLGGVAICAVGWQVFAKTTGATWPARAIHKGSVLGGILFGVGWALSGSCPSIALVALGEGQLGALWVLAGIFLGNAAYAAIHARWLRWSTGTCLDQ